MITADKMHGYAYEMMSQPAPTNEGDVKDELRDLAFAIAYLCNRMSSLDSTISDKLGMSIDHVDEAFNHFGLALQGDDYWLFHADWYTDGTFLWQVPDFDAEILGPEDDTLDRLNAAYRISKPDPEELARRLGLDLVPVWQRRGNEADGFYCA